MSTPRIFFEDFTPGDEATHGPVEVSAEEIVDFARQWDPQPMHLSEEGGDASMLGGLSASGWHTCCVLMRMMCDDFLTDTACMGSPGIEENRWLRPVHPGDRLTAKRTVLDTRPLASRPNIGLVRVRYDLANEDGERVLTMTFPFMVVRREAV